MSTDAAKLHCMIVPHLSYLNIGGKQEKDDLAHFIENMSQNIEQIAIELSSLVTEVTVLYSRPNVAGVSIAVTN